MAEEFSSFFLMKARLFDGVTKIYCAQMSEARNKKIKKIKKIHPLRIKQDKKRTEGPEEGR